MMRAPGISRMEFRNNIAMTAPASTNNTIQRVQRGTNRPVGKISGKLRKELRATMLARSKAHSQAGWRTASVKGSGIS
jgi:hypothetical protein